MNPIVSVQNLEKAYNGFIAVNQITFTVQKGAIYGFLGPNGAGKSTTIRMLCGILSPTSGEGKVAGYNIRTETEKIKSHIGYMSQKFSLYEDLTVEENIDFYSGIYLVPKEKRKKRKQWVLEMASLQNKEKFLTAHLPAGWKQRLALGCAILHKPKILFLDEPTAGVDPISRRQFWNLIYELSNQGTTVFVTTHYMDEAEYFDQIAFIYKGALIAKGSPTELKKEFYQQDLFEIQSEKQKELLDFTKTLPETLESYVFADQMHLGVKKNQFTLENLKKILEEQGFQITSVKQIPPSLEDLFVSLTKTHDQTHKDRIRDRS